MKQLLTAFIFSTFLISCNATDKSKNKDSESSKNKTELSANEAETITQALQKIDTDEALIQTALMAAPKESREGCTVIGYNMAGEFVTLKEGTNEFICLADDPKKEGFNAACYHKDLEPFMARGRALKSEGKTRDEIFDIREEEIKSGKLSMGKAGTTLHLYYGSKDMYNPETSEVSGAKYRYVVYLPFATSESTGLPEAPLASNHPWIMDPGTHKAHIMITPISN